MMKQNNKGLSLVELIVVFAIMAVVIGMGVLSFSLLFGTQAKSCAQKVSGMLSETKTGCLSRYDETMTLSYRLAGSDPAITTDGYYTENAVFTIDRNAESKSLGSEIRRMGGSNVVITVHMSDGSFFVLGQNNKITISFDRSSGAFEKASTVVDGSAGSGYIDKITFQSGLRTYTITMVQETGKHTLQG